MQAISIIHLRAETIYSIDLKSADKLTWIQLFSLAKPYLGQREKKWMRSQLIHSQYTEFI